MSKETKVSKSWFSVLEQCAPCNCLCVHPVLLSAERGRSAHQGEQICSPGSITGHASTVDLERLAVLGAQGTSSNQAPEVILKLS